jgi:hypothetical protein
MPYRQYQRVFQCYLNYNLTPLANGADVSMPLMISIIPSRFLHSRRCNLFSNSSSRSASSFRSESVNWEYFSFSHFACRAQSPVILNFSVTFVFVLIIFALLVFVCCDFIAFLLAGESIFNSGYRSAQPSALPGSLRNGKSKMSLATTSRMPISNRI